MPTINYSMNISGVGISFNDAVEREDEVGIPVEKSLPAGKAGTLSARTDNDTGTATLSGGHGITDGMIVDVYWAGGARYGMTVGSVATNDVPLDGGSGDNLPSTSTAVVVTEQVDVDIDFDGDDVSFFSLVMPSRGHIEFFDDGDVSVLLVERDGGDPYVRDVEGGQDNPFAGATVAYAKASNGVSTGSNTLKIAGLRAA